MGRYRATVHHNGLHPGDEVELDEGQVQDYAGEIDREFLVPVEGIDAWERDEIPDRTAEGTGKVLTTGDGQGESTVVIGDHGPETVYPMAPPSE